MTGMRAAWVAGKYVTINKSMIKYKGKFVGSVQYMRDKPIKHGIKVFSCCYLYTAVLLYFFVYVGRDNTEDGTSVVVYDELITQAHLTHARGWVLMTTNWYTSLALATLLFNTYGWTLVGTINPTDKQARATIYTPFNKLSKGAVKQVEKDWFREAVIEMKSKTNKRYCIQCITWRNKRQVCFLSSNRTGSRDGT